MKFDAKTGLALELYGGIWAEPAGHLQGAAADDENKFLYMSFTDRLIKVDMHTGEIVGSGESFLLKMSDREFERMVSLDGE